MSAKQQNEVPSGTGASDNDYVSRTGQKEAPVPVQKDEDSVEDPIDPATADSDEVLAQDERAAIDPNNIIYGGRTRGAAKKAGTYTEPGDEEGMPPASDGTSRIVTASANDI
ncbi:hypothetical protein LTS01_016580 [Friedmanniomyces endolithicus]|nr:hypothetical protein LTS01_016580 [Friedmanniomyces endolithicus]